jgi:hypothetical protein
MPLASTILVINTRTIYWAILMTVSILSCDPERASYDNSDIRGTWYRVTNDSIYDELIVTGSEFYTYSHETSRDLFLKYRLNGDSLRFFCNEENKITYGFERIDKNQFTLTHPLFNATCHRLDIGIDTMRILSTKRSSNRPFDEEYFSAYVNGMLQRKFEWM